MAEQKISTMTELADINSGDFIEVSEDNGAGGYNTKKYDLGDLSTLKDTTVPAKADKLILETVEKTADYILVLADADKIVLMNKATAGTLTVPKNDTVDFDIGTIIGVYNASAELLTIAGAVDVTVRNAGDLEQYSEVSLRKRAANEWVLAGSVS